MKPTEQQLKALEKIFNKILKGVGLGLRTGAGVQALQKTARSWWCGTAKWWK